MCLFSPFPSPSHCSLLHKALKLPPNRFSYFLSYLPQSFFSAITNANQLPCTENTVWLPLAHRIKVEILNIPCLVLPHLHLWPHPASHFPCSLYFNHNSLLSEPKIHISSHNSPHSQWPPSHTEQNLNSLTGTTRPCVSRPLIAFPVSCQAPFPLTLHHPARQTHLCLGAFHLLLPLPGHLPSDFSQNELLLSLNITP